MKLLNKLHKTIICICMERNGGWHNKVAVGPTQTSKSLQLRTNNEHISIARQPHASLFHRHMYKKQWWLTQLGNSGSNKNIEPSLHLLRTNNEHISLKRQKNTLLIVFLGGSKLYAIINCLIEANFKCLLIREPL